MLDNIRSRMNGLLLILLLSSLVSVCFSFLDAIVNRSFGLLYWDWNLFLAWLPLVFSSWLIICLRKWPWLNWRPMLITGIWVGILPNTFYLVSDLIHLQTSQSAHVLFDSVMAETFIINGLMLGYLSLYQVHKQLIQRVNLRMSRTLIGLAIFVCSYAIYLGRDLRWNSWDLLVSLPGVIFDASAPFVNPRSHLEAFTTTLTFFVFITVFYIVALKLLTRLSSSSTSEKY